MLGLLGRIFGGQKAVEQLADSGLKIIDKAFYTKEEKAENHLKARLQAAEAVTAWLQTSGGPNLARRFIAIGIFGMWFGLWCTSVLLDIASIFVSEPFIRESMQQVILRTKEYAGDITPEFMLVLGYYFAAPHLDQFVGPIGKKIASKISA